MKKLLEIYKNLALPTKASIWFVVVTFFQSGINLITTPIFTRVLSTSDYGIISVYSTWSGIISPIITLQVASTAYNKALMEKDKLEIDRYTSSILILNVCSAVIFYFVSLMFKSFIENYTQLSWILWSFIFLYSPFQAAMTIWTMQQRYRFKYRLAAILSIVLYTLAPLLSIIAVLNIGDNKAVVKVLVTGSVTLVASIFILIYFVIRGRTFFNFKYWKECVLISIPLIPHVLSMTILSGSDRIMITNLVSVEAAGKYSVAYSLASIVGILWSAINSSFMPWTMHQYKEGKINKIKITSNSVMLLFCVVCLIPICIAPEMLKIIAPSTYSDVVWVIPPVMVANVFIALYSLFCNIEYIYGKTQYIMIGSVLAAILNIVLNIIFIPIFGYVAAAYTTLVSYIFLSILHYIFMYRMTHKPIYDLPFLLLLMINILVFSILIQLVYMHIIIRSIILVTIIGIIIFNKQKIINIIRNVQEK